MISVNFAVLAAAVLGRNQHSDVRAIFFFFFFSLAIISVLAPLFSVALVLIGPPQWLLFFLVLLTVVPRAALLIHLVFMFYKTDGKIIYMQWGTCRN